MLQFSFTLIVFEMKTEIALLLILMVVSYFQNMEGGDGMLPAAAPLPSATSKRLKDMPRIFRNKIKKPLSFRINSCSLSLAVQKLRGHHGNGECWVGERVIQFFEEKKMYETT